MGRLARCRPPYRCSRWRSASPLSTAVMLSGRSCAVSWRMPARMRRKRHERRHARGRHAITQGLLAIGHGNSSAARRHADDARRHAAHDPLALLLTAQSAQLEGDRDGAQRAFRAMAEREDTRLLGLRGLFVEAQRADDPLSAVMIADEALKLSPSSTWASHAVLGFRCARGDWNGALSILDNNQSVRPDRQGDLPAPARRAAHRACAGAGKGRSRPRARKRRWKRSSWRRRWCRPRCSPASSRARRIRCAARCGWSRRHGWRSRIPILRMPMRM